MPQGEFIPQKNLPASLWALALMSAVIIVVFYGTLGWYGLRFSKKIGFANIWDSSVKSKQRFLIPLITGICLGAFFIVIDFVFSGFNKYGPMPHPPFPLSIVASATAGIGEELMFRLFFVSFWVWLVSFVVLKNRFQDEVFWVVSAVSAALFSVAHFPALMYLYGLKSMAEIPTLVMVEVFILNGAISVFAAYYCRKYGFLAAIGLHFWADIIWHGLGGLFR